jgi:hypothetical protein
MDYQRGAVMIRHTQTRAALVQLAVLAALATLAAHVDAAEASLQVHGLSHHFKRDVDYNERNAGAGIRYAFNRDLSVQAGAFNNSHSRTSVYALADWTPIQAGPISAGAFAGIATGYQWRPMAGAVTPIIGAILRTDIDRFNVALRVTPPHPKASAVAAIEIGVKF